jgi:hypothetical protein
MATQSLPVKVVTPLEKPWAAIIEMENGFRFGMGDTELAT